MSSSLTAFELERQQNIERLQAKARELGLPQLASPITSRKPRPEPKQQQRAASPVPPRQRYPRSAKSAALIAAPASQSQRDKQAASGSVMETPGVACNTLGSWLAQLVPGVPSDVIRAAGVCLSNAGFTVELFEQGPGDAVWAAVEKRLCGGEPPVIKKEGHWLSVLTGLQRAGGWVTGRTQLTAATDAIM